MPGAFDTGSLPGRLGADSSKPSQPGAMDGQPSTGLAAAPDAQHNGQPDPESAPTDLLPAVTLPKGGGAIRALGEKLSVDAATGTASMTLPLPLSPGRSDSPSARAAIRLNRGQRAVRLRLEHRAACHHPQDRQGPAASTGDERGVGHLPPVRAARTWYRCSTPAGGRGTGTRTVYGTHYEVAYYRPRIEGLFSRIERWTAAGTGISHWRTISRDNVTTLYGADSGQHSRGPRPIRRGSSRGTSAGAGTTRATWRSTSTPPKTARAST